MFGFYGKLLRVDLTERETLVEDVSEEILKTYLGGKGLGSYLLLKNVRPGTDPLSEENKLIFTTGSSTGTRVWGNSRYGVYAKSPLTGLYAESYSGGSAGLAIKRTGYDAVIIEGKARQPVFLEISDEGVIFHDARHLWGKETYFTEDAVLKEVGKPGASAVVIGPAGENKVLFACIKNNYWRSAGRTGMGAVMGSKNLKAIVFHGRSRCEAADRALLNEVVEEIRAEGQDNPGVENYRKYGTSMMVAVMNKAEAFPTQYWTKNKYDRWENISGDALLEKYEVRSKACPYCFIGCGNLTTVRSGKYSGLKLEGPEYETIYAFGGLCCIDDLDEIIHLNDLCDRLGMDTITSGNLAAFIMEAGRRGFIDYKLDYGDADGAAKLLQSISKREGIGEILAGGIKSASRQLGIEELAVHVKGLEPPGYDPRVLKGMGLGYATSSRGACHLRATFYKAELSGLIDRSTVKGKAQLYIDFEDRLTIFNTQILCVFYRDLIQWPQLEKIVEATSGLKLNENELRTTANRIIGLTRRFNVEHGLKPEDDKLPERLFKEPLEDVEDNLTREDMQIMSSDYYRIRGFK